MLIARVIADRTTLSARLDAAQAAMAERGLALAMARMLEHEGSVLHLAFAKGEASAVRALLEDYFAPCDSLIADHEPETPALFVSDMDSTMIEQECIDELADYAGIKPQVAEITERAMQGELDFESALRERVGLLTGLEEGAIDDCLADRISPTPGAAQLVGWLRDHGCRTVLVTGGFHHFADKVAAELGFDHVVGNRLEVADGKLTGALAGPVTDAQTKLSVLKTEKSALPEGSRVMAAGDGANDIPMLQAADYGFAYRAKPAARDVASGTIDLSDLSAIPLLLGASGKSSGS